MSKQEAIVLNKLTLECPAADQELSEQEQGTVMKALQAVHERELAGGFKVVVEKYHHLIGCAFVLSSDERVLGSVTWDTTMLYMDTMADTLAEVTSEMIDATNLLLTEIENVANGS